MTTFTQLTARLKNFLRGWLLALDIKEGLVKSATVFIKSEVMLTWTPGVGTGCSKVMKSLCALCCTKVHSSLGVVQ